MEPSPSTASTSVDKESTSDVKAFDAEAKAAGQTVWPGVLPLDNTPEVTPLKLRSIANIREHGEVKPYATVGDEEMMMHYYADEQSGGFQMRDEGRLMPQVFKDIAKKAAKNMMKGQFLNLFSVPSPAYMHFFRSQLGMLENDQSNCRFLYDAAKESDPLKRMKWVLRSQLTCNWINLTLIGFRAPLTPIMGETFQREMADGTKLYVEQMNHKPGKIGFLLESNNDQWRAYGQFHFSAGLAGLNTFAAERHGTAFIEFADGVKYELGCPNLEI